MTFDRNNRLVIAFNPTSSRAYEVQKDVFDKLDSARYNYSRIEVRHAPLTENVKRIKRLINDNDTILCSAGDGSAHAIVNSVLTANKSNVKLGFLAFGNFNDYANAFSGNNIKDPIKILNGSTTEKVFPMEFELNDQFIRYSTLYISTGWTANGAQQFDKPSSRNRIQNQNKSLVVNLLRLGKYYLKTRQNFNLPKFNMNNTSFSGWTDIILANGPTIARVFKTGKRYFLTDKLLVVLLNVKSVRKNLSFLLSKITGHIRGSEENLVKISFDKPCKLTFQCDGEILEAETIQKITILKSKKSLQVLNTLK